MGKLGIISGTVSLDATHAQAGEETIIQTAFGNAHVVITEQFISIQRHGHIGSLHIPPHLINHQAHLQALKNLGVDAVIGVHSTGSLKKDLQPGTIIIPDDFIAFSGTPTTVTTAAVHITPELHDTLRNNLIAAADYCGISVIRGGVYWQTTGPRLETQAEIRMMSCYADIVGMTMASEAIIAGELAIPYASLCSVDNYCNGIGEQPLTAEEITKGARKNSDKLFQIIERYADTVNKRLSTS
jgi:5'-methylthioadenosine phosphorylase